MKKILLLLGLLFLNVIPAFAITCNVPSSSYTYVSGQTILPNQVQTNENNLYAYAQSGVCNYLAGSITSAAISSTAGILYSQLNLSGGILPTDINTTTTTSIPTKSRKRFVVGSESVTARLQSVGLAGTIRPQKFPICSINWKRNFRNSFLISGRKFLRVPSSL